MAHDFGYITNPVSPGPRKLDFTRLCQATPQYQYHKVQLQIGPPPFTPCDLSSLCSSNQQSSNQSATHVYPWYTNDALSEPRFAATLPTDLNPSIINSEATPRSLDEEFAKYGITLGTAFDYIRAGRLSDASRLLVENSKWLVNNLQELGFLHAARADLLPLWNDFNNCWLALFQKQLNMKNDLVASRNMPTQHNLLSLDRIEAMGNQLIQLCDKLEPHGLVDYQIGILEENILSILGQCLDSMEQPLRAQKSARMTRKS